MNVEVPNSDGGSGRVLFDLLATDRSNDPTTSKILELNRIFARYITAEAEMIVNSSEYPFLNSQAMDLENDFYGLDRVMEWKEMDSIDALIAHNEEIVLEMEHALNELQLSD